MAGRGSESHGHRLAYVSLQAVVEGQDTWAAVMEIVRPLERQGWKVALFCPDYGSKRNPGFWIRLFAIIGVQWRVSRQIDQFDAVYIRAHMLAWPIALRARRRHLPVIQESNGSYEDAFMAWPRFRPFARLIEPMQKWQYRVADAVITVSANLATWLSCVTGRDDIVVSPNGANDKLFSPDAGRPEGLPERYAVFFGQFAPWQGIDTLLQAVDRPEWPGDLPLLFIGEGMMRPKIEAAAERNPLVRYLGQRPYAEVPGLVAGALVSFVLTFAPDRAGYSPLKLYEAMSCGVPVICSDTEGQAEYVRAEGCGIVVPPQDAAGVASAVATLAADPAQARRMGEAGRKAIEERYSWDARAKQRAEVIDAAIHARLAQR